MPLPPLPDNNTARYYVDYTSAGRNHTLMFRYREVTPGTPPSVTFIARVGTFFTDTVNFRPVGSTLRGARYSPKGSNISLPAPTPVFAAGAITLSATMLPQYVTFVGRSPTGRKFRLFLLGAGLGGSSNVAANDYRLTSSENSNVATAITNLEGWAGLGGTDGLYAIDEVAGTDIYNYVNLGLNAYWTRKARG